jgi:hypothetical protein
MNTRCSVLTIVRAGREIFQFKRGLASSKSCLIDALIFRGVAKLLIASNHSGKAGKYEARILL